MCIIYLNTFLGFKQTLLVQYDVVRLYMGKLLKRGMIMIAWVKNGHLSLMFGTYIWWLRVRPDSEEGGSWASRECLQSVVWTG